MMIPARKRSAMVCCVVNALIVSVMLLSGCDITTPEPPLNTNVNTPVAVQGDIGDFPSGARVAGIVTLTIPQNLLTFPVGHISFYVDSIAAYPNAVPGFTNTFKLNTGNFTDKEHVIVIAVYEQKPGLGIYNLLGVPRLLLTTRAIFDQTPPTLIDSLSVTYDGNIKIRWAPSACPTFKEYQVSVVFSSYYLGRSDVYKKTISDRATTSWTVDASNYPLGTNVDVDCAVSNGVWTTIPTYAGIVMGGRINVDSWILNFWPHPTRNETYAWCADNRMHILAADGFTELRKGPELRGGSVFYNADGSKFYIFTPDYYRLSAYSTADFSPVAPDIQLASSTGKYSSALIGSNGRIYVGDNHFKLWTYSESTGELLDVLNLPHPSGTYSLPSLRMAISGDGKHLYYTDLETGICMVNVSSTTPVFERRIDLSPVAHIAKIELTRNQQHLIVSYSDRSSIAILNAGDLSTVANLPLTAPPVSAQKSIPSNSIDFVQDGTALFVVSEQRFIEQFDLTTFQSVRSWSVINTPKSIGTSRDGRLVLIGMLGGMLGNSVLNLFFAR